MLQFSSLHPTVGIQNQLTGDAEGPVVLLNLFTVAEEDAEALRSANPRLVPLIAHWCEAGLYVRT